MHTYQNFLQSQVTLRCVITMQLLSSQTHCSQIPAPSKVLFRFLGRSLKHKVLWVCVCVNHCRENPKEALTHAFEAFSELLQTAAIKLKPDLTMLTADPPRSRGFKSGMTMLSPTDFNRPTHMTKPGYNPLFPKAFSTSIAEREKMKALPRERIAESDKGPCINCNATRNSKVAICGRAGLPCPNLQLSPTSQVLQGYVAQRFHSDSPSKSPFRCTP